MPEAIRVRHRLGEYGIDMSVGGLETVAARVDAMCGPGRLHVISDETVGDLYGEDLVRALTKKGRVASMTLFPSGEASKNLDTIRRLWDALLAQDIDRGDTVIAFGGGVVGDIAGFVASTVLRGIDVLQVPTTLLAMADASIGGKTGINHASGKNLIGSFHQPVGVLAWLPALRTLPDREVRSGLAEVVKSAVITGERQVRLLESTASALVRREDAALRDVVWMAVECKADIVTQDTQERGRRRVLNFGHTFAHAIEHAQGYGQWTHGEAVAVGMLLACRFAVDTGYCRAEVPERLRALLQRLNLPIEAPSLSIDEWMAPIARDKKRTGDDVSLILCREFGDCASRPVSLGQLCGWLSKLS